jgi:hypothetical protein
VVLALAGPVLAADSDWQFEQVRLRNGRVWYGLILEETPAWVRFQNVRRQPGRPAVIFSTTLLPAEIADIQRLPAAEHERLKGRIKKLEEAGPAEKQREERLELETIDWGGKPGAGRRYRSELFILESDAPEWIVRRAAGRLEQVYAAYTWFLPPPGASNPTPPAPLPDAGRGEKTIESSPPSPLGKGDGGLGSSSPTVIELFQSRAGYQARLKALGRQFVNVACYFPSRNRIFCFSDLERVAAEIEKVRRYHQRVRADLDRQEKELARLYRGSERDRLMVPIRDTRKRMEAAEWTNESLFDQSTKQLFVVLGHEAFHAYLASVVYPKPGPEPPRWLNEGLAQIFETAVVEAGELRVGHADRERLARAKEAVRKGGLVPLSRLLRSKADDFLATHFADGADTDVHYLTAWAVAFHLTFERRLLGTTYLDRYFKALANGADPEEAFAALVGQPVSEYETAFHQYLLQLQPDGTLAGAARPEK